MPYHGENAVRADQMPLTWMGCNGGDSRKLQSRIVQNFHAAYPYTGPSRDDMSPMLPVGRVYNHAKHMEVQRKLKLMLYTDQDEGCRILERDNRGRTSSIRPGRHFRPLRTATNAVEAAEATKFYPHQEYRIMNVRTSIPTMCQCHNI